MKRILLAAVLALAAAPAFAADNVTLEVSASVPSTCSISTSDHLSFVYDPVNDNASAPATDDATFMVTCTDVNSHTITFSGGTSASGEQRRMTDGSTMLNYDLYDSTGTTQIGITSNNSVTFTPTSFGAATSVSIEGRIPANQLVPSGVYEDDVLATIDF